VYGKDLDEVEEPFSAATDGNKLLAGGLGAVNLGGALYLGNLLSSPALVGVQLPSYFGLVQAFFPFLLLYGVLYNAVPAARFFVGQKKNAEIAQR